MAIFAIVQFEVHSYQDGRWTLQSRFPGDERQKAIDDAGQIESTTRRPCKVVKETYYPHENRSDSVTVYVSPRAKEIIARLKKPAAGYAGEQGAARAARGLEARSGTSRDIKTAARVLAPKAADIFWRAVIAMGLSLGSAAIVTAMVSWMLGRLPGLGINVDPSATAAMLTMTYMVVFFLGVFALFRFGAPIKRLIALLWTSSGPSSPSHSTAAELRAAGLRIKPKRQKVPFEQQQELADMKMRRGDLDTIAPTVDVAEVPKPTLEIPVISEDPVAAAKAAANKDKPAAPTAAVAPPKEPQIPLPASLDDRAASPTPAPTPSTKAQPVVLEPAFSQTLSELHRALALRFATEVMLPQIAQAPDDPVARRGAALFLTGAMAHLAGLSNLGAVGEMALTMSALPATLPRHAVDAFISQYNTHITAPANAMLMNQGRQAMARFLAGQSNDGSLRQSLATWRVPPPSALIPKPVVADAPPTDFYLMTELRHDDPAMMDIHNHVVREALEIADGREIKHTGRGILARFQRADEAVQGALAIAARLAANAGLTDDAVFAVALVPGYGTADDPVLSTTVTTTAQAMLSVAPRAAVICQPAVYQNAQASQTSLQADAFESSWLKLSELPAKPLLETAV